MKYKLLNIKLEILFRKFIYIPKEKISLELFINKNFHNFCKII